jgi:hypothetical protein
MKKQLVLLTFLVSSISSVQSQTTPPDDAKKVRFGLRISPQPTWFSSEDKNNIPAGAKFGFGFGLNIEYKISEVASFVTGIGGDFEGGRYKFRYDPDAKYTPSYWLNPEGEYIIPRVDRKQTSIVYLLKERKINTTILTFPILLKLFTSEYSGLRYFGLFGGELGFRLGMSAEDQYYESRQYLTDTTFNTLEADFNSGPINIGEEGSFPIRIGMHAGIGTEYRLGGTTTAFFSVSYFRSFINAFSNPSDYITYRTDRIQGKESYQFVKENLKLNAIRISVGILF